MVIGQPVPENLVSPNQRLSPKTTGQLSIFGSLTTGHGIFQDFQNANTDFFVQPWFPQPCIIAPLHIKIVLNNRFPMLECFYAAIHIDHKKVLTNRFPASSTVSWYFTHLQKRRIRCWESHGATTMLTNNNQPTAQPPSIPSLRLCTRSTQAAQWRRGEPPPSHLGPAGGGDVL